jgi:hypothetical protein
MADYEERGAVCGGNTSILAERRNAMKFVYTSLCVPICLLAGTWIGSEVVSDAVVFLVRIIRGAFCGAAAGFFVVLIVAYLKYGEGKTATRQPDDDSDVSAIELFIFLAVLVGTFIGLVIGVIVEFVA